MKTSSAITTLVFATILVASPVAVFAASSTSNNADFNYQYYARWQLVGPLTSPDKVVPSAVPFCHSGIVCYTGLH